MFRGDSAYILFLICMLILKLNSFVRCYSHLFFKPSCYSWQGSFTLVVLGTYFVLNDLNYGAAWGLMLVVFTKVLPALLSTNNPTVLVLVTQLCPTLRDPTDCSQPGSSVHGILQARVLEWVAIPFCRGSSQPRGGTQVSYIAGRFFTIWATRKAQNDLEILRFFFKLKKQCLKSFSDQLMDCLGLGSSNMYIHDSAA